MRPATSIFMRPPRRVGVVPPSEIDFHVGVSEFGKDAPKVAIGCSRRPPKPPPETPGPGFYNPPMAPKDTRIKIKLSNSPQRIHKRPLTANVDYIDARQFPDIRQKHIGSRDGISFIQPGDSPGCSYTAPSQLSKRAHRIGDKAKPFYYDALKNNTPGPERYTPKDTHMATAPQCQLLGPRYRADWLLDNAETPAPGLYNPRRVSEKRAPQFSIGQKSRRRKTRGTPFAIDQVIVNLESDISVEEAREYVVRHPQLKRVLREIISVLRQRKPPDPLDFLRKYFEDEKRKMNEKAEVGDELDLKRIIVHLARVERESEQKYATFRDRRTG